MTTRAEVYEAVGRAVDVSQMFEMSLGDRQWLPLKRWPLGLLATAHGEAGLAVEPIDLLVVHVGELRAKQVVQAAIAEPAPDPGQFDNPGRQRLRGSRRLGPVAEGVAG